jgi:hypothetical protein
VIAGARQGDLGVATRSLQIDRGVEGELAARIAADPEARLLQADAGAGPRPAQEVELTGHGVSRRGDASYHALRPGVAQTTNALRLLELLGLKAHQPP